MNTINTQDWIKFLINQQEVKTISIESLLKLFFDKLKFNNRKGTILAYKACLKPILKYIRLRKIYNCNQVTTEIINDYISLRIDKVKPITINKEVCSFKTMMKYAGLRLVFPRWRWL